MAGEYEIYCHRLDFYRLFIYCLSLFVHLYTRNFECEKDNLKFYLIFTIERKLRSNKPFCCFLNLFHSLEFCFLPFFTIFTIFLFFFPIGEKAQKPWIITLRSGTYLVFMSWIKWNRRTFNCIFVRWDVDPPPMDGWMVWHRDVCHKRKKKFFI